MFLRLTARGGLTNEHSWSTESEDGRFLLVMLCEPREWFVEVAEGIELKKRFSQSGVYLRSGSKDSLLWTLPYVAPCYTVFFAPNGEHVLLAQADPHHGISNIPVGAGLLFFHKDGSQQHWEEHDITWGWLLKFLALRMLGAEKPWVDWTITTDAAHVGMVTVNTNRGEEFVFDLTTGSKVRTKSVWNVGLAIYLVLIPLIVYGSCHCGISRSHSSNGPRTFQFLMAELLLLATIASALLALARYSIAVSVAVAIVGLVGGAIAWSVARGRLSWFTGSFLAVYGTIVGLVSFATLGEKLVWQELWPFSEFALSILIGCAAVGMVVGAVIGGWVARH
jgi:hypothetical protein